MVNLLRLGLVLFAIWLGLELSSKGLTGTLDGMLTGERATSETTEVAKQHKAGAAVDAAHAAGEERRNRLLAD